MVDKLKLKLGIGAVAATASFMLLARRRKAKRRAAAAEEETRKMLQAGERLSPLPFTFSDGNGKFTLGSTKDVSATFSVTPVLKDNGQVDTGDYILVHDYAPLENLLQEDPAFDNRIPELDSYLATVCPFFRGDSSGGDLTIVKALQEDGFHYAYNKKYLIYTRFSSRVSCSVTVVINLELDVHVQLEDAKEERGKPLVQSINFLPSFVGTTPAGTLETVGGGQQQDQSSGPCVSKFIYTNKDLGIRFGGHKIVPQPCDENETNSSSEVNLPLEDLIESRLSSNPSVVYFLNGNPAAGGGRAGDLKQGVDDKTTTIHFSLRQKVTLAVSEVPFPVQWSEKNRGQETSISSMAKEERDDLDAKMKQETALFFTNWEVVRSKIEAGEADPSDYTEVGIARFGNLRCATFDQTSQIPASFLARADEKLAASSLQLKSRHWIVPLKGKLFSISWECPTVLWDEELPNMRRFFDGFHLMA